MIKHQNKLHAGSGHSETRKKGVIVVGSMPSSSLAKQQATMEFERELAKDVSALSAIKSIKEKERVKAETLIPKYMPLVGSLVADGSDHPLLGQILVWCFDAGDIPRAMELAVYCIEHDVPMPERFNRDLRTYLCDTVIEWAEAEFEAGRSCEPYFSQVFDLAHGEHPWDLPDQVRGKFYRLRGMIAFKNEVWEQAVTELERAIEYGAKVKTLLSDAQKKCQDLTETTDPE